MLMRGSNKLVLDEADRSVHDALCVIRSIVKKRYMIAGGGAPEAECALRLTQWAKTLTGESSLSPSNLSIWYGIFFCYKYCFLMIFLKCQTSLLNNLFKYSNI